MKNIFLSDHKIPRPEIVGRVALPTYSYSLLDKVGIKLFTFFHWCLCLVISFIIKHKLLQKLHLVLIYFTLSNEKL